MSRFAKPMFALVLIATLAGCCWWPPYHDHGGHHRYGDRGGYWQGAPDHHRGYRY